MTTQTIEKIETEISPIVANTATLTITTEEDKAKASQLLSSLTVYLDRLIADRELITKPINESLKAIRAKYKPLETLLDTSIADIRSKISSYQTEQLRLQRIEEDKIASRVKEGKGFLKAETAMNKIANMDKPATKLATDEGQISFRTDRVLDIKDMSLIPDEYFVLNETTLLKDLKAGKIIAGATLKEIQTVITKR
jgi:hypothetical protein